MEAVWIALGGQATFLIFVAFLGRSLIGHWLGKDFELFKAQVASDAAQSLERARADLQLVASTELERLRSELAVVAAEHSILLSRLQDQRAQVIGELYGKVAAAIRHTTTFVTPAFRSGATQEEMAFAARAAIVTAQETFDDKQIWLTESCAKTVEDVTAGLEDAFNEFARLMDGQPETGARNEEAFQRSWELVNRAKVPAARRALEAEMRSLLIPASRKETPP